MKGDDKAAWRPRRFDVAGAHPDEVYRAVSNIAEAVERVGKQVIGAGGKHIGDMHAMWLATDKPLRFGQGARRRCAAVSGAVASSIMDELKDRHAARFERAAQAGAQPLRRAGEVDGKGAGAAARRSVVVRSVEEGQNRGRGMPVKDGHNCFHRSRRGPRYRLAFKGCFPGGPAEGRSSAHAIPDLGAKRGSAFRRKGR